MKEIKKCIMTLWFILFTKYYSGGQIEEDKMDGM